MEKSIGTLIFSFLIFLGVNCQCSRNQSPCGDIHSVRYLEGEWFDEDAAQYDPRFPELATEGEILIFLAGDDDSGECSFHRLNYNGFEMRGTFFIEGGKILILNRESKAKNRSRQEDDPPDQIFRYRKIEQAEMEVYFEGSGSEVGGGKVFRKMDFSDLRAKPD